jgi:hypothetical protein
MACSKFLVWRDSDATVIPLNAATDSPVAQGLAAQGIVRTSPPPPVASQVDAAQSSRTSPCTRENARTFAVTNVRR